MHYNLQIAICAMMCNLDIIAITSVLDLFVILAVVSRRGGHSECKWAATCCVAICSVPGPSLRPAQVPGQSDGL